MSKLVLPPKFRWKRLDPATYAAPVPGGVVVHTFSVLRAERAAPSVGASSVFIPLADAEVNAWMRDGEGDSFSWKRLASDSTWAAIVPGGALLRRVDQSGESIGASLVFIPMERRVAERWLEKVDLDSKYRGTGDD